MFIWQKNIDKKLIFKSAEAINLDYNYIKEVMDKFIKNDIKTYNLCFVSGILIGALVVPKSNISENLLNILTVSTIGKILSSGFLGLGVGYIVNNIKHKRYLK